MQTNKDVAIRVSKVNKSFRLPHDKHTSVKGALINFYRKNVSYEKQQVLKNINFEIYKGEFFGIVGRNGGGKSTLLKLLAGIYTPDAGTIDVNGRLTPFIELGVGFNPELTGKENVFLNGALLGFSRKEMEGKYSEIVAFSELGRFMDQKLKNYSSGMQVRLAFSIAIRAQSEILLLDEVLAVGDEAFQRKCYAYFAELQRKKKTVVLVTHDMDAVRRFCSRALLINKGKIEKIGNVREITKRYSELNRGEAPSPENSAASNDNAFKNDKDINASVSLCNHHGEPKTVFDLDDKIVINFNIKSLKSLEDVIAGITINKANGELVYWFTTEDPNPQILSIKRNETIKISLTIDNVFGEDEYSVNASFKKRDRSKDFYVKDDAAKFRVFTGLKNGWTLHPNNKVEIVREP